MKSNTLTRLAIAVLGALMTLAIILASMWQATVDADLVVEHPTRLAYATPTLYPTLPEVTPTGTEPVIASPTPASPLLEQCSPPAGWVVHRVQPDETLFTLAWMARMSVYALMEVNCLSVPELQTGMLIYLPPRAVEMPTPVTEPCGPPAHWRIYWVQPGDTLFRLALNYGTTIEEIRHANCMVDYQLYAEKGIYLPPVPVITPTWTPRVFPTPTWSPTPIVVPPTPTAPILPTPSFTPSPIVTQTPSLTPTPVVTPTPTTSQPTATPTLTPTVPISTVTPTPTTAPPTPTLPTPTPLVTETVPPPPPTAPPTLEPTTPATTPTVTLTPEPGSSTLTPSAVPATPTSPSTMTPTVLPTPSFTPTPTPIP